MEQNIKRNLEIEHIEKVLAKDIMELLKIDVSDYLKATPIKFNPYYQGEKVKDKEKWLYTCLTKIPEKIIWISYKKEIFTYVYDEENNQIYSLQDLGKTRIGKYPSIVDSYVLENQLLFIENNILARASTLLHLPITASYSTLETLQKRFTKKELKRYFPNIKKDSKITVTAKGIENYVNELTAHESLINCLIDRQFVPQWETKNPYKQRLTLEVQELYINPSKENINIPKKLFSQQ